MALRRRPPVDNQRTDWRRGPRSPGGADLQCPERALQGTAVQRWFRRNAAGGPTVRRQAQTTVPGTTTGSTAGKLLFA